MREIKRTDSLDINRYIDYLEQNGLSVEKNPLKISENQKTRNIAGINTDWIPVILDDSIRLDLK